MKNQKKVILVVLLIAAIMALSIAFALLSQTLRINGSAKIVPGTWEIKFKDLQDVELNGGAIEDSKPTLQSNDTVIGDYAVTLMVSEDSATYKFKVVNNGSINAKLAKIIVGEGTGTEVNKVALDGIVLEGADADKTIVQAGLSYTLKYSDGTDVTKDDTLDAGAEKDMVLKLSFTSSTMPGAEVKIKGLGIQLVYEQSLATAAPSASPSASPSPSP